MLRVSELFSVNSFVHMPSFGLKNFPSGGIEPNFVLKAYRSPNERIRDDKFPDLHGK